VRLAFFVITMLMVGPGLAPAQVDLAKALVGRWEGEIALRFQKTANPGLVLVITSVKEEGGRWTADARSGTKTSGLGPAKVEIDNSGKRPSLRWTGDGSRLRRQPVRREDPRRDGHPDARHVYGA
jgi:hypothetical protein